MGCAHTLLRHPVLWQTPFLNTQNSSFEKLHTLKIVAFEFLTNDHNFVISDKVLASTYQVILMPHYVHILCMDLLFWTEVDLKLNLTILGLILTTVSSY